MIHLHNYKEFLNEQLQVQSGDTLSGQTQVQSQVQKPIKEITLEKYKRMIDFTNLKPGVSKEEINKTVQTAISNDFYAICIPPEYVDHVKFLLEDSEIKLVSVLNFPKGDEKEADILKETIKLISFGVDELDMVMDYKALKKAYIETDSEIQESSYSQIEKEIRIIASECHSNGVSLKVIVESGELTLEELSKACEFVANAGADFIQTSTGTSKVGAELDKVKEMRRLLPEHIQIKIAGGIRNLKQIDEYYPYIDRIGTSVILK